MICIVEMELVAHLFFLGAQIKTVDVVGLDFDRHAFHDLETVSGNARNLARVVREESHFLHAEVCQNLGARTVLAQVGLEPKVEVRLDRVHTLFLQFISAELIAKTNATAFLTAHVKEHTTVFANELHGCGKLVTAIATEATKDIAREAFAVNAHINRLTEVRITGNPGHI